MKPNPLTFDEVGLYWKAPRGHAVVLAWADLRSVQIETSAAGPFEPDWFWRLEGPKNGCLIPGDVEGGDQFLERLQKLPGFDNQAFIAAMSTATRQTFLCWKIPD